MARGTAVAQRPKKKIEHKDKYEVEWSKGGWDYSFSINKHSWTPAFEGDDESEGWWKEDAFITACIDQEATCCGFDVLGGWSSDIEDEPDWAILGELMAKEMKKKKVLYCASYLPSTKEYAPYTKLLQAAGWVKGVELKTKHGGSYTNVRWEWFGKGLKHEKIVSARSL